MIFPWIMSPNLPNYDFFRPPLLYDLMNSMTNFGAEQQTKIKDLARASSSQIFDFDYPLSSRVDKEDFETMILNHFIDRRIAFETYTLFHIKLETKMNEIMPFYNKIFDSFYNWNLFTDGGNVSKDSTDNRTTSTTSSSTTSGTSDRRNSKMPQNNLTEIQNGEYLSEYNYDTVSGTDSSTGSGSDANVYHETSHTDVTNRIDVYERFIENRNKTMTMIFDDLESLFYGLVN